MNAHPSPTPHYVPDPRDKTGIDPDEVNARSNFSLQAVFQTVAPFPAAERAEMAAELTAELAQHDVEIRGWYDVGGFRADADLMLWALGSSATDLQRAYHAVLNSRLGKMIKPVWSAMAAHTPAEFNKHHLPACFGGIAPRPYIAVYPFVRSWDWYYLRPEKRASILREHGLNGRDHLDVQVSTLSAFALGDYEWTIALEADSFERIMSVLRKQRDAEARLFVRVDTPFFTGPRVELSEWVDRQPQA